MNVGEIRMATTADIAGIGKIIGLVWPENTISSDRVEQALSGPAHATTVSINEGDVVGFADGFLTTSADGLKRWELDLLAVHPSFQRRGIASTLVEENTQMGQLRGAEMARGLVAIDNVGSQRTFAGCGYKTDEAICELLVASKPYPPVGVIEADKEFDFIRVNTINYAGIWIEGERTRTRLENALSQLANGQDDLVGMVVPIHETQVIRDALSLGFERVGRYQWWHRPFN